MFKKWYIFRADKYLIGIIIFSLLAMLVVGYIFYNSSQTSQVSNERSNEIVEEIKPIVDPEEKIDKKDFNEYVRKAAHFFEFFLLGLALGGTMACAYGKTAKIFVSLPLLISLLVAVTDEFIQSFTGRTSKIADVFIDFSGATFGLLMVLFVILLIYKARRKKAVC
ncbi:MAG: VanZ family protein [Clostridia bacterium]|nr:VanZ family protein [Clostridia bacterium]